MRRKAWRWGFGAVIVGIVAYGILVPRRTPFEEGYGVRYVGETLSGNLGKGTFLMRFYASPETCERTAARIARSIGRSPNVDFPAYFYWRTLEGDVELYKHPQAWPPEGWPKGTSSYLITAQRMTPNLFQKAALSMGIRL